MITPKYKMHQRLRHLTEGEDCLVFGIRDESRGKGEEYSYDVMWIKNGEIGYGASYHEDEDVLAPSSEKE